MTTLPFPVNPSRKYGLELVHAFDLLGMIIANYVNALQLNYTGADEPASLSLAVWLDRATLCAAFYHTGRHRRGRVFSLIRFGFTPHVRSTEDILASVSHVKHLPYPTF